MRRVLSTLLLVSVMGPILGSALAGAHEESPTAGPAGARPEASVTASDVDPSVEKWARRFKGSILIFDHSITPETIFPNAQLSPIPSYQWWFSLRPRYYFTDNLSLRLRMDLTVDWTQGGAETTYLREPQFGDIWTDLVYSGLPKVLGVDSTVGLRVLFPTSKTSRMLTTILSLGVTAGLNRDFETRIGTFGLTLSGAASHTFFAADNGELVGGLTYACNNPANLGNSTCDSVSGRMNPYLSLTGIVSGKYSPHKRVTLSASYILINNWRPAVPDTNLNGMTIPTNPNAQTFDQKGWFLASIDVETTDWLSLSLGYYVYRSILTPGSTIGNPFWSPGGDSRIFFSFNFALDAIYKSAAMRAKGSSATARTAAVHDGNAVARF